MVYSSQNAAFRRDKNLFFSQLPENGELSIKIKAIEQRAQTIDYSFLLKHQQALEVEFTELFEVLQKQRQENKEAFWFYCYYCASLLEAFHHAYGQEGKAADYKDKKQKIKQRLNKEPDAQAEEESFIQSLQNSFLTGFRHLSSSPFHVSKIRDYVAYANVCRIYWAFCRLTLTQSLTIAKDLKLIDKLDLLLGTHTDVDKIIATFQAPIGVINYFSVGFFLIRFVIDAGLLIKHTFFPSALEKGAESGSELTEMEHLPGAAHLDAFSNSYIMLSNDSGEEPAVYYISKQGKPLLLSVTNGSLKPLSQKLKGQKSVRLSADEVKSIITSATGHVPEPTTSFERFKHELYKRHCNFANDLVWATVNFLTNFNNVVHISGPVAGYITSVFLVFDVCMALYKCNLAKQEYLTKKAQYTEEMAQYNDPMQFGSMSAQQRLVHIEMLNKQLIELEHSWRAKEASFYFGAAAAALLMIGFTASMFVSAPLLVAASFFVCTIAVAMYLSTGAYSQYKDKSLRLEQAKLTGEYLAVSLKEYEVARNEFIFTMVKNTIMPIILIATYAICWPAAVALTAVYLGYELVHAYDQHVDTQEAKRLALNPPFSEEENENSEEDGLACCYQ